MNILNVLEDSNTLIKSEKFVEAFAVLETLKYETRQNSNKASISSKKRSFLKKALKKIEYKLKFVQKTLEDNPLKTFGHSDSIIKNSATLKKKYHQLALLYHPDKNKATEELFKLIRNHFEILSKINSKPQTTVDMHRPLNLERMMKNLFVEKIVMMKATTTSITFEWSFCKSPLLNHGNLKYNFELNWKRKGEEKWIVIKTRISVFSCQKHNLRSSTSHLFRVRAFISLPNKRLTHVTPFSVSLCADTMQSIPSRIQIPLKREMKVIFDDPTSFVAAEITWISVRDIKFYELEVRSQRGCEKQTTKKKSITLQLSGANKYYSVKVRGVNKTGYGVWSAPLKIRMQSKTIALRESLALREVQNLQNVVSKQKVKQRSFTKVRGDSIHSNWNTQDYSFFLITDQADLGN